MPIPLLGDYSLSRRRGLLKDAALPTAVFLAGQAKILRRNAP